MYRGNWSPVQGKLEPCTGEMGAPYRGNWSPVQGKWELRTGEIGAPYRDLTQIGWQV